MKENLFRPAFLSIASMMLTYSANIDKESEVESILQKMESDVRSFRDELERVYSARCDTKTLMECYKGSFNDCSSTFPNQKCLKAEEFVLSACGDGISCNGLWDKSVSKVSIPAFLAQEPLDNPSDPDIIETACYTRLAEPYMVDKYASDEEYWAQYNVEPSWTYFGSDNGLFRQIPALHQKVCGSYDPRRRPWFVAGSSGPKDVVLVLDVSGSMIDYGRMDIAKEAAITIVETLTVADRFAVIAFSSDAANIGGHSSLIRATIENKNQLIEAIRQLQPLNGTNFYNAFENAFDALDSTIKNEATSGCNIAVLFMTDGQISEGPLASEVIDLVNTRTQQIASNFNRKTTIFTFSLGQDADHNVTKTIACSTGGIWAPVYDSYGDLESAMASYYKLFALGLGEGGNEDFVAWVEPYKFYTRGVMGTTVSAPVYDRNVTPPLFLGVVAVDCYMSAIENILGETANSSTMLQRFVARSTAYCPNVELSNCQLEALRFLGGSNDTICGSCNRTSYAGIVPEKCPFESDLPGNLWHDTEMIGKEYERRACCESGETVPSESCPSTVQSSPNVEKSSSGLIIAIVVAVIILCAMSVLIVKTVGKRSSKSSLSEKDRSAIPVAVCVQADYAEDTIRTSINTDVSPVLPPEASAPPSPLNLMRAKENALDFSRRV